MKDLTSVKLYNKDAQQVGWDDLGEYDKSVRTLVLKSARWNVQNPELLLDSIITVKANEVNSGDSFVNDMKFKQQKNNATVCLFVGS